MTLSWRIASVELVAGYHVTDRDGRPADRVADARVAFEGGFAHIEVPGTGQITVVSAPAIQLITYQTDHEHELSPAG
jgi:hypothetical protein